MGTKQAFKTYARTQRIQDTNLSFAEGMHFTDAPLVEGFSRLLVNFDFNSNEATLKPRKGLATQEYVCVNEEFPSKLEILAANQITHNGVEYYQVIVGAPSYDSEGAMLRQNTNTVVGDAWVITLYRDEKGVITFKGYVPLNIPGIGAKCIFSSLVPHQASIHGIALEDTSYARNHIGTFAFNGAYYYFTTDSQLHYTYFNPSGGNTSDGAYDVGTITPYTPLQYETQNSRYNMLLSSIRKDPYQFSCAPGSGVLTLTGFAPINKDEQLVINPRSGIVYDYILWYTYPALETPQEYCLKIEYTTGDNVWYPIPRDETETYKADGKPFKIEGIKVDAPFAQFRIYAILKDDATFTSTSKQFTVEAMAKSIVLPVAFNYAAADRDRSVVNLGLTRYDLSYARGITYWKNRLWVFGAAIISDERILQKQDNTILFASDPNRPDWFPYTAGADIFDEEIMYLQPMLDELLVFTAHNLYSLTMDADGLSWTKKHLQANLNIAPWDLKLIQIVKNMVFFKSGNYYYMVVPKLTAASGAGLAIAPVSKNIAGLLDNFSDNIKKIIDDLFNYSLETRFAEKAKVTHEYKLVHNYNFLDYEDVHNNYVFKVTRKTKQDWNFNANKYDTYDETKLLTVSLLYNTVSRTWRIYTTESDNIIHPILKDATNKGLYATLLQAPEDNSTTLIQFLRYTDGCKDSYIQDFITVDEKEHLVSKPAKLFPNWQYLDSGNLDQNTDMKKRFREYQFKVVNETSAAIDFYSGFYLDRVIRTYEMNYTTDALVDEDAESQVIIVSATPALELQGDPKDFLNREVPDELVYKYSKLGTWKIGASKFPTSNTWKIRIPTSGKGYLPRIILISYNETSYELLSCATVYRQLYSR